MPGFGPAKAAGAEGLRVTPLARRLIAQGGIDLAAVAAAVRRAGGSRIAKADVLALLDGGAAAQPADAGELVALNRIRRATARHLAKAWAEVPHVFQAVEVDFHRVERARKALNAAHAETWGLRLTFLPFVARAVCLAVKDFPLVNARLEGGQLRTSRRVHLGIAVDLDHGGLVVPVIRGAEDLTVVGLARAVADLVAKARAGGLTEGDLAGGTYTISNSGTFDTLFTAPIVNAPQVAILSTDGVRKKPVVVEDAEDGDRVAIRPVGVVGQSFDHRAFDGAYSAAFLARVRAILETTDWARAAD
jgi:2-oxoglutarate dehydrogenase E2 component (dihydrolipoamide succinyltransferase)